jgi:Arc/MetJ family transcription regulator
MPPEGVGISAQYPSHMATRRKTIELDEELLERTRAADGVAEKSDTEVVQDALSVYLGMRALDEAQALGGLDEDEANRIAVEEVRAVRRAHNPAA